MKTVLAIATIAIQMFLGAVAYGKLSATVDSINERTGRVERNLDDLQKTLLNRGTTK